MHNQDVYERWTWRSRSALAVLVTPLFVSSVEGFFWNAAGAVVIAAVAQYIVYWARMLSWSVCDLQMDAAFVGYIYEGEQLTFARWAWSHTKQLGWTALFLWGYFAAMSYMLPHSMVKDIMNLLNIIGWLAALLAVSLWAHDRFERPASTAVRRT